MKKLLLITILSLAILMVFSTVNSEQLLVDPTSPIFPTVQSFPYPSDSIDPELDSEEPQPNKKGRVLPSLPVDLKHLPLPNHIEFS